MFIFNDESETKLPKCRFLPQERRIPNTKFNEAQQLLIDYAFKVFFTLFLFMYGDT